MEKSPSLRDFSAYQVIEKDFKKSPTVYSISLRTDSVIQCVMLVKVRGNNHIIVQKLTACVKCYGTLWVKIVYSNNKIEEIGIVTDDLPGK